MQIRDRDVGPGRAVFVVAEIGINHDGSLEVARELVEGAHRAGCDAVKLQKRTPERCVPRDQWNLPRETPWGRMTYIDYRHRIELGAAEYAALDRLCRDLGILWFASSWDEEALAFIDRFDPPCHKAASASLTDLGLLRAMRATGRPLMLSTGMSTMHEIEAAVAAVGTDDLLLAHATSAYPCVAEELNLRVLPDLAERYPECPIGYSGHEIGIAPTIAAVALGACFVERHITLDRARWGSDHGASLELDELGELVRQIRQVEKALGDGVKRVYDRELAQKRKLRRVPSPEPSRSDPPRVEDEALECG